MTINLEFDVNGITVEPGDQGTMTVTLIVDDAQIERALWSIGKDNIQEFIKKYPNVCQ